MWYHELRSDFVYKMVTLMLSLNVRAEKRRLTTVGVFCPRTTAELGDRPGLVSARMVGLLSLSQL